MLGNKNFVLEVFVTDRIFCSPKDKQNILSCFMAGILPACFFVGSPDGKQNILSCLVAGILPACFFTCGSSRPDKFPWLLDCLLCPAVFPVLESDP